MKNRLRTTTLLPLLAATIGASFLVSATPTSASSQTVTIADPIGLDVNADGDVVVAEFLQGQLVALDPGTLTTSPVASSFPYTGRIEYFAVAGDGRIFGSSPGPFGGLVEISADGSTTTAVGAVSASGRDLRGVAIAPDGSVLVSNPRTDRIVRYEYVGGVFTGNIEENYIAVPDLDLDIDFGPDGALYTGGPNGVVRRIDFDSAGVPGSVGVVGAVPSAHRAVGLGFDQCGTLYVGTVEFTGQGSDEVWRLNSDGTSDLISTDVDQPRDIAFDGNNTMYVAEYRRDQLLVVPTPPCDSDGDGVTDEIDPFPHSKLGGTVIIDGRDTGVANMLLADGATFMDLICEAADNAADHGAFVSDVAALTNEWKKGGLISGKDKGRIMSAAAGAAIPQR